MATEPLDTVLLLVTGVCVTRIAYKELMSMTKWFAAVFPFGAFQKHIQPFGTEFPRHKRKAKSH
jgi:hypothetical protein